MLSNKLAFGLMGLVALMGAAGVGAFVATRRAMPTQTVTAAAPAAMATPRTATAVDATEATLDDSQSPATDPGGTTSAGTVAPVAVTREAPAAAPVAARKTAPAPAVASSR